jgi:hypothetical protein
MKIACICGQHRTGAGTITANAEFEDEVFYLGSTVPFVPDEASI